MQTRRMGRPPLDEQDDPSTSVHVRMTAKSYDELYAEARQQRVTVPELIRRRVLPRGGARTRTTPTRDGRFIGITAIQDHNRTRERRLVLRAAEAQTALHKPHRHARSPAVPDVTGKQREGVGIPDVRVPPARIGPRGHQGDDDQATPRRRRRFRHEGTAP